MNCALGSIAYALPVKDLLATLQWYEEKLAFHRPFVYREHTPDDTAVSRDGQRICFFKSKIDPKKKNEMCRVAGIEALGGEYRCPRRDPPVRANRRGALGTEEFEGWTKMELSLG